MVLFFSGKQLGLQTILGKNIDDEVLIKMDTMSNGHVSNSIHDNELNLSINPLSAFFSSLTFSFRPYTPSKSSYAKQSQQAHSTTFHKNQRNGDINNLENNSIYHELIQLGNDDNNNNKTKNENNQNSVIINLPSLSNSQLNEYLINDDNEKSIFTREHFLWIIFATICYFTWFIFIAGISIIHFLLYFLLLSLYFLSDRTRRFALAILIYLTYLLLYDALHLIPNYTISKVHIRDVYLAEKRFFGIYKNGHLMTLNEYFRSNHIPVLDLFSGLFYLNW